MCQRLPPQAGQASDPVLGSSYSFFSRRAWRHSSQRNAQAIYVGSAMIFTSLSCIGDLEGGIARVSVQFFLANPEPYGIVPTAPQRWPGGKRSGPGQPCGLLATINMTFGIRKGWEGHRGGSPYGLNGEESAMRAKRLLCRQRKTKGDPANGRSSCAGCFARRW